MPDTLNRTSSKRRRSVSRKLSARSVELPVGAFHELGTKEENDRFHREWGLTLQQEEDLLQKFMAELKTEGLLAPNTDKFKVRRFLRARQHDLVRAKAMWADDVKWRKEFGCDTILEDFHFHERDAFISVYPQGYHKTDKMGRPIYIQHLGQINVKKIMELTTDERSLRFHVQEYERCARYIMPACSKAANRHIEQTFAIIDVKGVGMKHLTGDIKKSMGKVLAVDQNHYPEMLGRTCIINAPGFFKMIFGIVKPMLDARTQGKIELCGTNYLPSLLKWVDKENLPEYLGGTSTATLLDDAGPWQDPQILSEINAELKTLQHTPVEETSHEDLEEDGGHSPSSTKSTQISLEQGAAFQDPSPNLMRLSSSATSVGEDGYYSPASEASFSGTSSPDGDKYIETTSNPLSDHYNLIPINARVKALEDAVPGHQQRLGAKGAGLGLPGKDLETRVSLLEDAMQSLLSAQEQSTLHTEQSSSGRPMKVPPSPFATQSKEPDKAKSKCCGCVVQ